MRFAVIAVTLTLTLSYSRAPRAVDFSGLESECAELGFKRKTQAFGECVLELDRRKARKVDSNVNNNSEKNLLAESGSSGKAPERTKRTEEAAPNGDGTPDHITCSGFGVAMGTAAYSNCRQKIYFARQENTRQNAACEDARRRFELELLRYEEQFAAQERQRDVEKNMALLNFGLALMGGTSPNATDNFLSATRGSFGVLPIAPPKPPIQNFTITGPGNRMANCHVSGNSVNCF